MKLVNNADTERLLNYARAANPIPIRHVKGVVLAPGSVGVEVAGEVLAWFCGLDADRHALDWVANSLQSAVPFTFVFVAP